MTTNGTGPHVEIKTEDIQAVLAEERIFALLVENRALKRTLQESVKEISDVSTSKNVSAKVD
jgi:hypothetical protein